MWTHLLCRLLLSPRRVVKEDRAALQYSDVMRGRYNLNTTELSVYKAKFISVAIFIVNPLHAIGATKMVSVSLDNKEIMYLKRIN